MRTPSLSDESVGYAVGIFVFIFLAACIYNFILNKKRKDVISNYCKQNGLNYTETSNYIMNCNEQFDIMQRGKDQSCDHIMSGTSRDYDYQIFDFCYTLEKPDPKYPMTTYNEGFSETICFLTKKGKPFPHFYMLAKSILQSDVDFLPKVKDFKEVELLTINDEQETVLVKTRDEDAVLDFFDLPRTDALKTSFKEEYIYEGKGECLLVSYLGLMSVKERLELLDNAVKVFESLSTGMNKL